MMQTEAQDEREDRPGHEHDERSVEIVIWPLRDRGRDVMKKQQACDAAEQDQPAHTSSIMAAQITRWP